MSAVSPFAYSGLRAIHLEVTSHCNLACPMCARNVAGGRVSPNLTPSHMSLSSTSGMRRSSPLTQTRSW